MLNFTVGPVMMGQEERTIGAMQVPYFRTAEFSSIMHENEELMKKFSGAKEDSRAVFITGSGTAAMEATIMNVFNAKDKVLIVNGGSFGHRFVQLCEIHKIPHSVIKLEIGQILTEDILQEYKGKGYSGFVVNVHETSTGVYYDMDLISRFCRENELFLVVDAISSFLADEFKMADWNVDVMIAGSQKALACPPGISIIVLSKKACERIEVNDVKSMYFDLKNALKNGERGQTPFTPAVGILLQINARLKDINLYGVEREIERVKELAMDFRKKVVHLPFEITSKSMSNAVTPLHPFNTSAYEIFNRLKDEYSIWICPNSGELSDKIFRVGHIGALTKRDNEALIKAFHDLYQRGIL